MVVLVGLLYPYALPEDTFPLASLIHRHAQKYLTLQLLEGLDYIPKE